MDISVRALRPTCRTDIALHFSRTVAIHNRALRQARCTSRSVRST